MKLQHLLRYLLLATMALSAHAYARKPCGDPDTAQANMQKEYNQIAALQPTEVFHAKFIVTDNCAHSWQQAKITYTLKRLIPYINEAGHLDLWPLRNDEKTIPLSTKTITVSRQDMESEHWFLRQSFFTVPLSIAPNVRYNDKDYGDGLYAFEIQFEPQTPGNPYTLTAYKTAYVEDGMIFWGERFDAKNEYELQQAYPNHLTRPKKSSDEYKKFRDSKSEKIYNRYINPLYDKRPQISPKSSKIKQNDKLSITVKWSDKAGKNYPMDGAQYHFSSL